MVQGTKSEVKENSAVPAHAEPSQKNPNLNAILKCAKRYDRRCPMYIHIDHDHLILETESDVEQKVVMPLLAGQAYLAIPANWIFTKGYMAPTALDKAAGRAKGYYPDYSIWSHGFPIMVVEVKAPEVSTEGGYREASLYARHLNQNYATEINPCRFLVSTNGRSVLFGYWDSAPVLSVDVSDLRPGSAALESLQEKCARSLTA